MSKERLTERQADVRESAARLTEAVAQPKSDLIRDATIQRFEFTFEVVWKTLKLYLERQGHECGGPRPTLKKAFAENLIPNPERPISGFRCSKTAISPPTPMTKRSPIASTSTLSATMLHYSQACRKKFKPWSGIEGMNAPALRHRDLAALRRTFQRFPCVREVRLFGSRATGHARRASDIDLAISAPEATAEQWLELTDALDQVPIIYEFDIVRPERAGNPRIIEKISREGLPIYPDSTHEAATGKDGPTS